MKKQKQDNRNVYSILYPTARFSFFISLLIIVFSPRINFITLLMGPHKPNKNSLCRKIDFYVVGGAHLLTIAIFSGYPIQFVTTICVVLYIIQILDI